MAADWDCRFHLWQGSTSTVVQVSYLDKKDGGKEEELSRCQDLNRALGYWPCGHRVAGEKGSAQPSVLYLEITVSRLLCSLLRLSSCPAVTFQPPGYRPRSLMTSISSSMLDMKGSSILHTNLQEGP